VVDVFMQNGAGGDARKESREAVFAPKTAHDPEPDAPGSRSLTEDEESTGGRFLDSVDSWTGDRSKHLDLPIFFQREALALAAERPERAALMHLEAARTLDVSGADDSRILEEVESALELRPHTAWLLKLARRLLLHRGLHARALQLAEREVQAGGDSHTRAAVLFEASSIYLQRMGSPKESLRLAEQALRIKPHHLTALVRVAALREQLGQYAEAARALQQLGEYLISPARRAQLLYATGTLIEMRLGQEEAAQAAYLRATEADPTHVPSLAALCEVQERMEQWSDLARTFERLADFVEASKLKSRLLYQAGKLHFDRTANLEAACRALAAAAAVAPQDVAILQYLAHCWETRGRPEEALHTLEQLLELTLDRGSRAAIRTQIATLQAEQLNDTDQAIAAYSSALAEAPGYLPALQSLGALYRRRGDFASLVDMSNPETEGMLPATTRAQRHIDLAELLERRLDEPDRAVAAYRRALELEPGNTVAFAGLSALLRRREQHSELAELLAAQAEASTDPHTRAHLLLRRSWIQSQLLRDPAAAIATLCRARPVDGARSVALTQLDLHAQAKRTGRYVELLLVQGSVTEDLEEAKGCRLLAARLLELELDEPDKALDIYQEVLEEHPASAAALHGAGRILDRRGDWNELVKLHFFELDQAPDRPDAPALLCRAGRILAEKLGNHTAAVEAYARALEKDPTCRPALAALEQLARGHHQWSELASILERRAEQHKDSRGAELWLCRAAEVAGWQLGLWDDAARLYRSASDLSPNHSTVEHGLLRVLLHEKQWERAAELMEALIETSSSAEERGLLELSLARLYEFRLGREAELHRYERAARAMGGNVLDEQLLRVRRMLGAEDLAQWLYEQGQDSGGSLLGAAFLVEAAHLWELASPPQWVQAADASRAARQRQPDDLNAVWTLERALCAQGEWHEVGTIRELEAELELDRTVQARHLTSAAEAYARVSENEAVARLCRESVKLDPQSVPALHLLLQLAEQSRDWGRAAEIHDQIAAACADADNRRHYALRAAEIWAGLLRDPDRALTSVGAVLADDPSNEEAFAFAAQLLRSEREFEELSRLYQRAIEACGDPARKIELIRQNAQLLRQLNGGQDPASINRAIAELMSLLSIQPDDVDALATLAELQTSQSHWSDAAATLQRLIDCTPDEQRRHTARIEQAELWLEKLHEPGRARQVLEAADEECPHDLDIARLRLRALRAVGDWSAARELLEGVANNEEQAVRLWAKLQLAEIAHLGLKDTELQQRCERDVLALAAGQCNVIFPLRGLGLQRSQVARLLELAEEAIASAPEANPNELRRFIAAIAMEELDDPMRALPHLEALLAETPDDVDALLLMARALEARENSSAASDTYRHVLERDAANMQAYRGLTRTGSTEVALSAAAIVDLLGEVQTAELKLLTPIDWDELPNGSLSAEPPQPEERFTALQQILEALLPYLHHAYPPLAGDPLPPHQPAAAAAIQLASTIGLGSLDVRLGGTGTARVGIGQSIVLQLDPALAERHPDPEFRFWVGRALARAIAGGAVLQQLDEAEFAQLFAALRERRGDDSMASALQRTLQRSVPRKIRRHIDRLLPKADDPQLWSRYARRLERWADRLGLVLCRHPGIGLRSLARSEGMSPEDAASNTELASLMRFVVSDDFARIYRNIWRPRRDPTTTR
jgi:tetratricopeptide (TPR) repeat protein